MIAPLLLTLLFGIFEVGRALHVQQTLTYSAHEGARLIALHDATVAEAEARIRDVMHPVVASAISVTGPDANSIIRVGVETNFQILHGAALLNPFSGVLRLRGESAMLSEN